MIPFGGDKAPTRFNQVDMAHAPPIGAVVGESALASPISRA